jgi:hypothetical protein
MERLDDITGGGYTDGTVGGAWTTWNPADGTDTTSPDTTDQGTPGADNSDPNATVPPHALPYATPFEPGDPTFIKLASAGTLLTDPPSGTFARSGSHVLTTDSLTQSFDGRLMSSADCIALRNGTDTVDASLFAMASTDNGGNQISARIVLAWFTDSQCQTAAATPETVGATVDLTEGSYSELAVSTTPPAGASHLELHLEVKDDNGGDNTGDGWCADDALVVQ